MELCRGIREDTNGESWTGWALFDAIHSDEEILFYAIDEGWTVYPSGYRPGYKYNTGAYFYRVGSRCLMRVDGGIDN